MKVQKDNPGVYIPPPLFYVVTFLTALFIQSKFQIDNSLFHLVWLKFLGILFLFISLFFLIKSFRQFFKSRNTLITIRAASSLQTTGIYNFTRNPMYVGLAIAYLGISCIAGNWWNFILFPLLLLTVQEYIIKREEKYLERAFGQEYIDYRHRVRRWL